MAQEDVLRILKQFPDEWWTAKELADKLNITQSSVNCNLKKLRDYGHVICRYSILDKNHWAFEYKSMKKNSGCKYCGNNKFIDNRCSHCDSKYEVEA